MLNASNEYTLAARGGGLGEDAVKPVTRTLLYREYNGILEPTVTGPDAIDPRFNIENVLNSRNPLFRGISYGPMDEYYLSDDPETAFRFIENVKFDEERDIAYYIPKNVASAAELADVIIDYGEVVDVNCINARYDNSRTQTDRYDYRIEVYGGTTQGNMVLLYDELSNNDGSTEVFFDGTDWDSGSSRVNGSSVPMRFIRLIARIGGDRVNPRIMHFGAQHVVRLDDDVMDLGIVKSEMEQSTYLPYGESSSNSLTLSLDNTAGIYRYGPTADEDYLDKYQKITVEFGFDVSKYGGIGVEYVPGGTYYIEDFEYDEAGMTMSIQASDYGIFLKEQMCNNFIWTDKSLKHIIKDCLAQAGFSPRFCTFNFGISGNANEANRRKIVWSNEEQSVWDFLSTLIKSELGTMYFDEENGLVFTDREYFRTSIDNGVKATLNADVDIVGIDETNTIGANKISVKYSDIGPSKTEFNPAAVTDATGNTTYINLGPKYKNDVLWSPSDNTFLGSSVVAITLKPNSTFLYLPITDANQISEDEGLVRIGREFIRYSNRTLAGKYLRLKIEERGAFDTPVNGTIYPYTTPPPIRVEGIRNKQRSDTTTYATLNRMERRGLRLRRLHKSVNGIGKWGKYFVRPKEMSYSSDYDVYGMSFTFNELPSSGYVEHQAAGMFIHNNHLDRAIYFEVNKYGIEQEGPNMIAYKGGIDMGSSVLMPPLLEEHSNEKRILFAESGFDEGGNFKVGTPIDILVYNDRSLNRVSWFVNGNLVGSFDYTYSRNLAGAYDMTTNQKTILETNLASGEFGVFLHGSTDITVDYMFATNKDQFDGYDLLRAYNPATNSFERDFLPESFSGYYEEFGSIVHEAGEYEAEHSVFPSLNPRLLNTLEHNIQVHYQTHTPFNSRLVVSNNDRYGVNLNGTNFSPDGTSVTSGFIVYGVPIVTEEEDQIEVIDKRAVQKYGPSEVEISNEWIDSVGLAKSIAKSVRAHWKRPVTFFELEWFPIPTLQPGDRVLIDYPEKGFTNTDIWIVIGVSISYDGGLSGTLSLKRFTESPPVP